MSWDDRLFLQAICNVIMFIPFGLLLPSASQKKTTLIKVIVAGFLLAVLIETMQFVLQKGYAELDDVLHNTLGALIGGMIVYVTHCEVYRESGGR